MLILQLNRVVSSVGSEHRLDRAGVTGSSPVQRTKLICYAIIVFVKLELT